MKNLSVRFIGATLLCIIIFWGCSQTSNIQFLKPPKNLTISAGDGDSTVVLRWEPSDDDVDGYRISFNGQIIERSIPHNQLTYVHTPTKSGTYRVWAFKDDAESGQLLARIPSPVLSYSPRDSSSAFKIALGQGAQIDTTGEIKKFVFLEDTCGFSNRIDFYFNEGPSIVSFDRFEQIGLCDSTRATRFKKIAENLDTSQVSQALNFALWAPIFDMTYTDSIEFRPGDLIAFVLFQRNEPTTLSPKNYGLLFIYGYDESNINRRKVYFATKVQLFPNMRLIGGE